MSTSTSSILGRLVAVPLLGSGLVLGVSTVADPAPAYASQMHVEQQCVIPAVTGNGLKGRHCDLFGIARWVDDSQRDTPEWARNALRNCAIGALVGLAEVYLAPPQAKLIWMAVDCVEHVVADAIVTGGR